MVNQAVKGQAAPTSGRTRIGERVRDAWEQSKPPAYHGAEDSLVDTATGRLAFLARGQEGISSVFFFATFATVLIEVLLRLFGHPVVWAIELPTDLYIWTFCIAAGLSDWNDRHLAFDLVAQKLPPRVKAIIDVALNALFVVVFAACLPGCISFLKYAATQPSSGFSLNQAWGYAGIVGLFGIGALLRGRLLVIQVTRFFRKHSATAVGGDD